MTDTDVKDLTHKMNGLFGRMGFSIDELLELSENEELIPPESITELQSYFEEMKDLWKDIRSSL